MQGVVFLVTLLPANALSPNILHIALRGLLLGDSDRVLETVPLEFVPRLVEASAVRFFRHTMGCTVLTWPGCFWKTRDLRVVELRVFCLEATLPG